MKKGAIMAYKLFWQSEPNVVYFEIIGAFNEDEMYEACYEIRDNFLETNQGPIHIIVDPRAVDDHPRGLHAIRDASQIYINHTNLGWMILIGVESPITKFLTNVALQVLRQQFKTVKTLEDALSVLLRVDNSVSVA
jgi:hypothetical protein